MIQKMQRKFVRITMLSTFAVIFLLVGSVNLVNLISINQKAGHLLSILTENDGSFPKPQKEKNRQGNRLSEETPFETRYFIVRAKADGAISQIDTSHIAAVSPTEAQAYAQTVLDHGKTSGYRGVYQFSVKNSGAETLIVFVDCQIQLQNAAILLIASASIGGMCLLLIFLLVSAFSKKAIHPMIKNMEKQKQFITDAGHELKTPLAILLANTDVLEMENGENEWTASIRSQSRRMELLVNHLLTLSKMEEERAPLPFSDFSMSDAVLDTAAAFCSMAELRGTGFSLDVPAGLCLNGNEESVRRLLSILFDNAVKYTPPGGKIHASLRRRGKGVKFSLSNPCAGLPDGDLNRLFDRFYRGDSSRARASGGYGVGLSIAQAIVQAHKGKLSASREENDEIRFTVIL